MMMSFFDPSSIKERARQKWNNKSEGKRLSDGKKYQFIFLKQKRPYHDWASSFDDLTKFQQNLIIKGELIRTYDALPNFIKTRIKKKTNLNTFSSKWYKLPSDDKKKLLDFVL